MSKKIALNEKMYLSDLSELMPLHPELFFSAISVRLLSTGEFDTKRLSGVDLPEVGIIEKIRDLVAPVRECTPLVLPGVGIETVVFYETTTKTIYLVMNVAKTIFGKDHQITTTPAILNELQEWITK